MLEYWTHDDVAAEVQMVRARFDGAVMLVEGADDCLFFEKFIDPSRCYIVIGRGKDNVIGAVQELESTDFLGILGIVDADYWNLTEVSIPSLNVVVIEVNDIELLMFKSDALLRIIREYGSEKKIEKFLTRCGSADLRQALLESCIPIGFLRLLSNLEDLRLKFNEIKYKTFVEAPLHSRLIYRSWLTSSLIIQAVPD